MFFVNPLLYEKNIAVTAVGVADNQTVKNLPKRLSAAIEEKKKKPLITALKGADRIVTGVVEEIRALPDEKLAGLRSLANGYDLYSEHSPRWRQALIRVQSVLKGDQKRKDVDRHFSEHGRSDVGELAKIQKRANRNMAASQHDAAQ